MPDFILKNFRWKAGALILAIFVWFLIQLAISEGFRPSESLLLDFQEKTFSEHPVRVLTAPGDTNVFKITPDTVTVTIRATASVLERLTAAEVRAFVDLSDSTNSVFGAHLVRLQSTEGVGPPSIKANPVAVMVERLNLTE